LVEFFLDKFNRKHGKNARLEDGVLDTLISQRYPGNVRELENLIEQAVALSVGDRVTLEDIMPPEAGLPMYSENLSTLSAAVATAERSAISSALRAAVGNREKAAEALAISPTTLWRKMTRLGIEE
jgi:two-component system response regulator HydG